MSYMYGILAVVGWVWTGVVAVLLSVALCNRRGRGFEVLIENEKQP